MRQRSTQVLLAFVIVLTVFSVAVAFPTDPTRYLPGAIPWPEAKCVGPVCIGKGIHIGGIDRREMRLGLDLRGGTRLVLEADTADSPGIDLNDAMNTAVDVVERRVNAFGVAESITERVGDNRISVQLPGISSDEAVDRIGRTAQLQFMELGMTPDKTRVLINQPDGTQATALLDQVLASPTLRQQAVYVPVVETDENGVQRELNGSYLDRSDIFITRNTLGQPILNFGMNSEGSKLLEQATTRLVSTNAPIAFALDGDLIRDKDGFIVAPSVNGVLSDRAVITGLSTDTAKNLDTLLRTGAFPVPLTVVQQEDVDATLGDSAVVDSVHAGLIAIFVVMAFMTLYYRLPGVIASLALFVYVSVTLMVYKMVPVTITSAGMAAFVLSVGMAVDANILIFERMKEELRLGRSLTGAIDAGFSRAWTSIRDSNVATLITCFILFWFGDQFGASLVKGFALTLALGVVVSMFSAITVTRTFLQTLVGTSVMRHLWLFGADVVEAREHMGGGTMAPAAGQAPRSTQE
jgi:preprotein translocase subunit SecD